MKKIEENRTETIHFRVSKNEYEQAKNNAKEHGEMLSEYARRCIINPYLLSVNYDEIEEHTREITEIKQAINLLIGTLVKSGNYYPNDIENLLRMMNDITESEKNLIKLFRKSEVKLRRELEKIVLENSKKEVKK